MKTKFDEILLKIKHTVLRYPMILVMAFLASAGAVCMIMHPTWNDQNLMFSKFTLVSCLGISLMFALKIISQRVGREIVLQIAGITFLISFYFYFPVKEQFFTENYIFVIIPTFILSHLLVAFGAFIKEEKEISFWQYNKNLFVNLFLTIVFTGVLTGGVELAILAADKLFDLSINSKTYQETFFILLIFGSSFIFLLFSENGLSHLEKDSSYPVILKFFTQFVLIPLLLMYVIILYFYSAKIIINWELPRGWVSYLILAYSIVGILALLLVHPLKEETAKSWVKGFSKVFYYTLLPLLVLLYVAIFTRILEYGFTEPRYFVLLIALWLTSVVLYFIFSRKTNIRFIPVSLFAFGLFALVFPYLNAFSVAKRSQKNELEKLLDEKKILKNNTIDFSKNVDYKTADEIGDKFEFLTKRKEFEYLLSLVDASKQKDLKKEFSIMNFWRVNTLVKGYFPNITDPSKTNPDYYYIELKSTQSIFDIGDYQYIANFQKLKSPGNNYDLKEINIGEDKIIIEHKLDDYENPQFLISLNADAKIDLISQISGLFEKYKNQSGTYEVREISIEKDLGKYHIRFFFDTLSKTNKTYYFNNAQILIRKK